MPGKVANYTNQMPGFLPQTHKKKREEKKIKKKKETKTILMK